MAPPSEPIDAEIIEEAESQELSVSPKEMISFALGAARRRWKLSLVSFGGVFTLALLANTFLPRTYHTEARISAQGQASVIRAITNPGRPLPEIESPTKGAAETLLRRDNLVKIVRDARLVERFDDDRPPLLRFKDKLVGLVSGPVSASDREAGLIGLLEKRLTVVPEDQAVTIGVDWGSPKMAYEIVVVAQKTFIESRRAVEVAVISDAIALLEGRTQDERPAVDAALKEMQEAFDTAKGRGHAAPAPAPAPEQAAAAAPVVVRAPRPVAKPAEPDKELLDKLAEKRRAVAEAEATRQRKIAEVKAQLEEQRSTLGAAHPTLIATEKRLEALSDEPSEITALRNEERALLRQVNADVTAAAAASMSAPRTYTTVAGGGPIPTTAAQDPSANGLARLDEDPQVAYSRGRFDTAVRKYDELMSNLEAARTELDNAKAAFKYRYSIARPAEVPLRAVKPKPLVILGGGFAAALLLGLLLPATLRLLTGRVQEPWQVRTQLKLPVLGEVKVPSK